MKRTQIINKQIYKNVEGKCRICKGDGASETLDVHRIVHGEHGGRYSLNNTVVLCPNCHRKVHTDKTIVIDRWYQSSAGYMLRILENGVEKFV